MTGAGSGGRRALALAFALGAGLVAARPRAEETSGRPDPTEPYACGTVALYMLGRLEGVKVAIERIDAMLGDPGDRGHSLAELAEAAAHCGLELEGIRLGPDARPPREPFLAHVGRAGEGHFVVVRPLAGLRRPMQVIDPPGPPYVLDFDCLASSPAWTGVGLRPVRGSGDGTLGLVVRAFAWATGLAVTLTYLRRRLAGLANPEQERVHPPSSDPKAPEPRPGTSDLNSQGIKSQENHRRSKIQRKTR